MTDNQDIPDIEKCLWRIEMHPTVNPIPIRMFAIVGNYEDRNFETVFDCVRKSELMGMYERIRDQHNAKVLGHDGA